MTFWKKLQLKLIDMCTSFKVLFILTFVPLMVILLCKGYVTSSDFVSCLNVIIPALFICRSIFENTTMQDIYNKYYSKNTTKVDD